MELKYIVTRYGFAVFSKGETHKRMAAGMEDEPLGAGFCTIARGADSEFANVHCYGESISLNIKSRPEDEEFINQKLKSHE